MQDLKLSDALRYHMHDTTAAKDLLFRRLRCLANYENANKVLAGHEMILKLRDILYYSILHYLLLSMISYIDGVEYTYTILWKTFTLTDEKNKRNIILIIIWGIQNNQVLISVIAGSCKSTIYLYLKKCRGK